MDYKVKAQKLGEEIKYRIVYTCVECSATVIVNCEFADGNMKCGNCETETLNMDFSNLENLKKVAVLELKEMRGTHE